MDYLQEVPKRPEANRAIEPLRVSPKLHCPPKRFKLVNSERWIWRVDSDRRRPSLNKPNNLKLLTEAAQEYLVENSPTP